MNTTDNVTFTLQNFTLLANGELKFRQDGAWTINWGNPAWPSGIGTQGGSNILAVAGTYNVTFNITTGAYSFDAVTTNYDVIGFNGGFNQYGPTVPMGTADGVAYVKIDYQFTADGVKFKNDSTNPATIWGNTAFPSGTATVDGPEIPLTAGFYNVDFNKNTLDYNFVPVPVSIVGDAAIDYSTDIDMTTIDGINFTLNNQDLIGGKKLKFRTNYSWSTNWGGKAFPIGTGVLSSPDDIPVDVSGTYNITFNRVTGDYVFTLLASAYPSVSNNAAVMQTTDGITYTKVDQYFDATTPAQFNDPTNPATVWGATAFPSGTAVAGGTDKISVPAGFYNVTFDRTTGAYSYTVVPISLIGAGVIDWNTDVTLDSADNGINSTKSGVVFAGGDVKFRANAAWTTSWGGSTAFPTGTAIINDNNNIPVPAGTYDVSFNRVTGEYNFAPLGVTQFDSFNVGVYPNPTSSTFSMNVAFEKVKVYAITGQLVKSFTKTVENQILNVSDLNSGIYFVKGADANGKERTVKLIKQ